MNTVVRLPYPRLSCDRFSFPSASADGAGECVHSGSMHLLTDSRLFEDTGVRIAFTTREGGVSKAPFDTLNLGTHVNDDLEDVLVNRQRLLNALGTPNAFLVVPNQVHGTDLVSVQSSEGATASQATADEGADGIIVSCEDVAALLCFADCMPVILVSPMGDFAVIHAGWRGVYGHIAKDALAALCETSNCQASECNAYIGPYIHGECFEVGADLAQKFESEFGSSCIASRDHVDLGCAMRVDLQSAGMLSERIASAGICTVCNSTKYYSYRAAGGVCGRHGAIAVRPSR